MSESISRASSGQGSIATFGPRLVAFLIDGAIADLIAAAINGGFHNSTTQSTISYVAFLLIELLFVSFFGQTPGMRALGIAVVRVDGQGRAKPQWVLFRTVLLATVIPAVITDASGRGMHDRASGTVMLRTR